MPKKIYSKSDLVLHLYDVAQRIISIIAVPSEENQAFLENGLNLAKDAYLSQDSWWDYLAGLVGSRTRGPEFDELLTSLSQFQYEQAELTKKEVLELSSDEVEKREIERNNTELLRLQAFREFIISGGWDGTSANTRLFNQILSGITTDFSAGKKSLDKWVYETLHKEIINIIDARNASFLAAKRETEERRKELEAEQALVARMKDDLLVCHSEEVAQEQRQQCLDNGQVKTLIYFIIKEPICQFYLLDSDNQSYRLIHGDLKTFYEKAPFTPSDLSSEELDQLKTVLLQAVLKLKGNTLSESTSDQLGPVKKMLKNKQFTDKLTYNLKVSHCIEAPSLSSADLGKKPVSARSSVALKYSPEFFQKLEDHLAGTRSRPKAQSTGGAPLNFKGKEIHPVKISEAVAKNFGALC